MNIHTGNLILRIRLISGNTKIGYDLSVKRISIKTCLKPHIMHTWNLWSIRRDSKRQDFIPSGYQLCCFSETVFPSVKWGWEHSPSSADCSDLYQTKSSVSQIDTGNSQFSYTSDNDWLIHKQEKRAAVNKYTLSLTRVLLEQLSAERWSLNSQDSCWTR